MIDASRPSPASPPSSAGAARRPQRWPGGTILCRHARLTKAGNPIFCAPSRAELAGRAPLRQTAGTDGKVIYSTREAAEAAARELESLGARPLRSYLCGRSRSGHFHLTTDTAVRPSTHSGRAVDPGAARPALGLTRAPGSRPVTSAPITPNRPAPRRPPRCRGTPRSPGRRRRRR